MYVVYRMILVSKINHLQNSWVTTITNLNLIALFVFSTMQVPHRPDQTNLTVSVQPDGTLNQSNKKRWDVGLCECRSIKLTLLSCFCPCCVFGSITQEMDYPWCICCLSYLIALLLSPIIWIHVFLGCSCRRRLRHHYRIKGHIISDFCASLLCSSCMLYQSAAQIAVERYKKMQPGVPNPYTTGLFRKVGHMIISCYSIPRRIRDEHLNYQSLLNTNNLTPNNTHVSNLQLGLIKTVDVPYTSQPEQPHIDMQSAQIQSHLTLQAPHYQLMPEAVIPDTQASDVLLHKIQSSSQLQQTQNIQNPITQSEPGESQPIMHI